MTFQLNNLIKELNIQLVPAYKVKSKEETVDAEKPVWTERPNLPKVTESYDQYMKKQVMQDLAMNVLQLCDAPIDPDFAEKLPSAPYSFPNGYTKEFLVDRVKVPEGLFDLNYLKDVGDKDALMNVSQIANTACGMVDIDMRPAMYSNVVVTGGNSLILGFSERLNHDLALKCPPTIKLRVSAAPVSMERRFSSWIGGSIVASLGFFQQQWISKAEYEETGSTIVEKKCP